MTLLDRPTDSSELTWQTPPCVVLIGPQGAGKSTQNALLRTTFGLEPISTGDLLRRAVADDNAVGRAVECALTRGDLVPDDIIVELVRAETRRLDGEGRGYVLDGFPRTVAQAVALQAGLANPITATIELIVPRAVLFRRLSRRRVCTACGASTAAPADHVESVPCQQCACHAVRRPDDTPAAIMRRLTLYDRNAEVLTAWLRHVGPYTAIDCNQSRTAVHEQIVATLLPVIHHAASSRRQARVSRLGG